jgi:hypothetical protein
MLILNGLPPLFVYKKVTATDVMILKELEEPLGGRP